MENIFEPAVEATDHELVELFRCDRVEIDLLLIILLSTNLQLNLVKFFDELLLELVQLLHTSFQFQSMKLGFPCHSFLHLVEVFVDASFAVVHGLVGVGTTA